jgi:hypothetical protein
VACILQAESIDHLAMFDRALRRVDLTGQRSDLTSSSAPTGALGELRPSLVKAHLAGWEPTLSPTAIVEPATPTARWRQHPTRGAARAGRAGARWLHPSSPHRSHPDSTSTTNHPIPSTTGRLEGRPLPRAQLLGPSQLAGPGWPQAPVPGDPARAGGGAWSFHPAGALPDAPASGTAAVGRRPS